MRPEEFMDETDIDLQSWEILEQNNAAAVAVDAAVDPTADDAAANADVEPADEANDNVAEAAAAAAAEEVVHHAVHQENARDPSDADELHSSDDESDLSSTSDEESNDDDDGDNDDDDVDVGGGVSVSDNHQQKHHHDDEIREQIDPKPVAYFEPASIDYHRQPDRDSAVANNPATRTRVHRPFLVDADTKHTSLAAYIFVVVTFVSLSMAAVSVFTVYLDVHVTFPARLKRVEQKVASMDKQLGELQTNMPLVVDELAFAAVQDFLHTERNAPPTKMVYGERPDGPVAPHYDGHVTPGMLEVFEGQAPGFGDEDGDNDDNDNEEEEVDKYLPITYTPEKYHAGRQYSMMHRHKVAKDAAKDVAAAAADDEHQKYQRHHQQKVEHKYKKESKHYKKQYSREEARANVEEARRQIFELNQINAQYNDFHKKKQHNYRKHHHD